MSTSKPKLPDNPETLQPYDAFDPIPQPDVSEGGDSVWALWNDAHSMEPAPVANPAPAPVPAVAPAKVAAAPSPKSTPPMRAPVAPPAPVAPAAVPRPAASSGRSGLEKLIEESRRSKRVCPMPGKWIELDTMLRRAAPAGAAADLAPPPRTAEWAKSTSLAKRLMIRDMIDWAAEYGLVEPMMQFLRALPEDQWYHMGE